MKMPSAMSSVIPEKRILKEVTPLTTNDCFTIFSRKKSEMTFPVHFHEEFELNLILNGGGLKRIVGDHSETISDYELVLIGPNVVHGWMSHEFRNKEIIEVTIQWHKDLLDEKFLQRNQLHFVRKMFERSARGILFSEDTIRTISDRILLLDKKTGFDSVMELLSILHDLSTSRKMLTLSEGVNAGIQSTSTKGWRIEQAFGYMNQNFSKPISLADVARIADMTEVGFSRFIRKQTGYTFIESLTDIRLSHATRMLIDTSNSIVEIAYTCGFHNLSNFNRVFKKKKNCTPREFRENFFGVKLFI